MEMEYDVETTTQEGGEPKMREFCFCGRVGELEDRTRVHDGDGYRALRSPKCGHLDRLGWLPEDARRPVPEEMHGRKIGQLTAV